MNRPRPVLTAAGISSAIVSLGGVLTFLGYAQGAELSAESQTITAVGFTLGVSIVHLIAGLIVQSHVTPLSSPVVPVTVASGPPKEQEAPPVPSALASEVLS